MGEWVRKTRACLFLALAGCVAVCARGEELFDPSSMTMEELMFLAARYGNTPEKREHKTLAKEEMRRRGPESLRYLVANSHIENIWFQVYAQEIVEAMSAEEAVPVLLEALESPEGKVRKMAAYFLGFYTTPEHAVELIPLLDDDEAAGAAIRTLGKWHVTMATMMIIPFLQDEEERKRVTAANALRDIGDPRAAPYLIHTLNDEFFTVRETAARALFELGPEAERAILRALPRARDPARRCLIRILGDMRSQRAVKPLRRLLADDDWRVRGDAARALFQISPIEARRWLRNFDREGEHPFVRTSSRR